jgi:hypothetical protein
MKPMSASVYNKEISAEAERWLYHGRLPPDWFTVVQLVEWHNAPLQYWARDKPRPGEVLAALELLVSTGHLEAGTDEFGARVFRCRQKDVR